MDGVYSYIRNLVTATTFNLVPDTDTVLRLFDTDGSTLLAYNDDDPGLPEPVASRIIWTAPATGTYFIMVRDYYRRGDCLGYDVNAIASQALIELRHLYVPQVERMATVAPTPTDTPSPTPTESPTPSQNSNVYIYPDRNLDAITHADTNQDADINRDVHTYSRRHTNQDANTNQHQHQPDANTN